MPPPEPFALNTCVGWHQATFPADAPLLEKVEKLRADLIQGSRKQLTALAQVLIYAANYSRNEYRHARKASTGYHVALHEALTAKREEPAYDLLFGIVSKRKKGTSQK